MSILTTFRDRFGGSGASIAAMVMSRSAQIAASSLDNDAALPPAVLPVAVMDPAMVRVGVHNAHPVVVAGSMPRSISHQIQRSAIKAIVSTVVMQSFVETRYGPMRNRHRDLQRIIFMQAIQASEQFYSPIIIFGDFTFDLKI